jgi:hypothetical protein
MSRHGLFDTLDRDHFYPSLDAALAAVSAAPTEPAGADGRDDPPIHDPDHREPA